MLSIKYSLSDKLHRIPDWNVLMPCQSVKAQALASREADQSENISATLSCQALGLFLSNCSPPPILATGGPGHNEMTGADSHS